MQFHYPMLLWALSTLVLPLLIHLFHLRRAKRIYFSHLPILRQALHTSHTRTKLRHRVVLFCRMLALVALVMAFAQPYLPTSELGTQSEQVLLYIDNSYSMQNLTTSNETAMEVSLYTAQQIVESYSSQTKFFLLTNDRSPLRTYLREEMLDRISTISYSIYRRSSFSLQQRIRPLLDQSVVPMDVYWISDFQKNLFSESSVEKDSTHNWCAVLVEVARSKNLFVDTAYSKSPVWMSGEPNRLCVRVQNMRDVTCDPCTVKFFVENVQQALQTLRIDKQSSEEACFLYTPLSFRSERVEVRVDDPIVQFDNTFYVSLTESTPVKIMEILSSNTPTYVEKVYNENARFSYQQSAPEVLSYEQLYTQDLLILHGLQQFSSVLVKSIEEATSEGATLLCIPPEGAKVEDYALLLPGFKAVKDGLRLQSLSSPNYGVPFYSQVFDRIEKEVAMPSASLLYEWRASDLEPLLQFANRRPFLSRTQRGSRRYLFSSPLSQKHTNFTKHSLFVPTMYKIASSAQQHNEKLYHRTETKSLQVPVSSSSEVPLFQLGSKHSPLEALRAHRRGQQYVVYVEEMVKKPGLYELRQDTSFLMWLAFNLPAVESDLRSFDKKALREKLSSLRKLSVVGVDSPEVLGTSFAKHSLSPQLWRYFLCVALLFLFVEIAYLRYF